MSETMDARAEYIAGLRKLADLLERNPAAALPLYGRPGTPLSVYIYELDGVDAWAAMLCGPTEMVAESGNFGYELTGCLEGLHVQVRAPLEVLQHTVTGTVEVEQVEWRTPLGHVRAGLRPQVPGAEVAP
jgi:hypothetical protein